MALKIKVKQGTSAPATGALDTAELGYDTVADKLYVGNGAGAAATGVAMAGHSHGDIEDDGQINTTVVAPASGDYLLITDASSANTIKRSILIGSGTTTYLRNDGTWVTPADNTTLASLGVTATAAELNVLDGITATVTELNYTDGVASNIQTQLNGKAETVHNQAWSTITSTPTTISGYGITNAFDDSSTYRRLMDKAGAVSDWVSTTQNGLIPYASGGSGSLGTSAWPFYTIYGNTLYEGGTALSSKYAALSHTHTLANITDSGAAAGYGVTDSASASALGTGTSLTTERDVYYGTPTINGSKAYNSSSNIYAPTTVGAAGQVAVSSGSGAPSYQYRDRSVFLSSNFTNATTTLNPVTGLTFAMEAGKKYHVRFLGTYESATSTTGCLLGVRLSTGAATVRGYAQGEISASEIASGLRKAIYGITTTQQAGSYITTTGMSAPGTYQALELDIVVQCATAGSILITFGSEVAGSTATLHAGSAMIVDELSV